MPMHRKRVKQRTNNWQGYCLIRDPDQESTGSNREDRYLSAHD